MRQKPSSWLDSLSTRLLLTCTLSLALTMAVVATSVVTLFEVYPSATLGRHVQSKAATELITSLRLDAQGHPVSVHLPEVSQMWYTAFPNEVKYRFLDAAGKVWLSSNAASQQDFPSGDVPFDTQQSRAVVLSHGWRFNIHTVPFVRDGQRLYLQTAVTEHLIATDVRKRLGAVKDVVIITVLIAILIFALAMRFTFNGMLKPLRRASEAAAGISPRNLTTRLSLEGIPSELRPLIGAFNDALGRLEAGFKVQQSFLASTAHELQTPLTLIRGQIDMADDLPSRKQLLQDVDLMSRQVRQLLHLAEVSEPQNYQFMPLDLMRIVDDVVAYLERQAAAKQVHIVVRRAVDSLSENGDEAAVFVLLKNLIENAIAAAPPFSDVTVEVTSQCVAVSDDGAGIPPEHLSHIFTRFWRAPGITYDGAGLGLSICREIASAHDWRISVDPAVLCTRFLVSFDQLLPNIAKQKDAVIQ
jgi:signal transduction histidine kinase